MKLEVSISSLMGLSRLNIISISFKVMYFLILLNACWYAGIYLNS